MIAALEKKMAALSEDMRYEEAAVVRDRIRAIYAISESQKMVSPGLGDADIIGFSRKDGASAFKLLFIRNGIMIGARDFMLKNTTGETDAYLFRNFMEQFYAREIFPPPAIYCSSLPEDATVFSAWLTGQRGSGVRIRTIEINPDLLVLSMPVVPGPDARRLSALFKVPVDADGFFMEAHVKLRPVDSSTDGVFMAGMAHYPKLLDESIIQAQAAAGRAARVLSQDTLVAGGRVAVVDAEKCTGCLTCLRICPFNVPQIQVNLAGVGQIIGAAYIEAAICQGCGSCVAECPARAIQLMHYTDAQMAVKVRAPAPGRINAPPRQPPGQIHEAAGG